MNHDALLPSLDWQPSDPPTYLGPPAALASCLSTVKRAIHRPQPWIEHRILAALVLSGGSLSYGQGTAPTAIGPSESSVRSRWSD